MLKYLSWQTCKGNPGILTNISATAYGVVLRSKCKETTIGYEKLDPLLFLSNSLNIQCRTLKHLAMCFY